MASFNSLRVNLNHLHYNIKHILSYKKGSFMFVLKANAYSHGYIEILKELEQYDAIQFIGVATPEEALLLYQNTSKQIVILGYTQDENLEFLSHLKIIPTIFSLEQATLLSDHTDAFINVDTGFHRLGKAPTAKYKAEINQILALEHINILGIFSHLKLIGKDNDIHQIDTFEAFTKDLDIKYKSLSDSIAYTRYNTNENLYRIGALMFGLTSKSEANKMKLKPTTSLHSFVTRIEEIVEDDTAFYRSKLTKGMRIATIQIGYADGIRRSMPAQSYVVINSQKCRYIEVGMDQSIIDVTGKEVSVLDEVTIFGGNGISLQELADLGKTNKNSLLTTISSRVKRLYIKTDEEEQS